MNKNILIAVLVIFLTGGFIFFKNQSNTQKQVSDLKKNEKKIAKDLELKEDNKPNVPLYKGAKVDEEKCGKDAFYIEEKSADFVKNYCQFLKESGWKLVHQDYPDCNDIKSFGGGYNYQKGEEKISISVIRYGEKATCFWVYDK